MLKSTNCDLLSVVITAYNEEKYIKRAIESLINQTYKNIELIIVNDGSTDNTLDVVNQTISGLTNILLLTNEKPTGLMAARNLGVASATGKYISFLDADDTWDKRKAEIQLKVLKSLKNESMIFCGRVIYPTTGKPFVKKRISVSGKLLEFNHMKVLCMKTGVSLGASLMIEKKLFDYLGGFDKQVGKERDLIAKCALLSGKIYWLGLPLYEQHIKPNSMSTNYLEMFKKEKLMLEAWAPNSNRHSLRSITPTDYEKYRDTMLKINSRAFITNHIELPTELIEYSKNKKARLRYYIFIRSIKNKYDRCIYRVIFNYYKLFNNSIVKRLNKKYE